MKIPGWGKPIQLSRAVEDPIEATFDMGTELKERTPGLNFTVNFGIAVVILFILSLVPNLLYFMISVWNISSGRTDLTDDMALRLAIMGPGHVIMLALLFTLLLFSIQLRKFYRHIYQRYDSISDLKITDIGKKGGKKGSVKGLDKPRVNPIRAMLDLVEESSHQVHKIIRLLELCVTIILFIMVFLAAMLIADIATAGSFIIILYPYEILLGAWVFILIPLAMLLSDSARFFIYYDSRHHIIDSVRFGKIPAVPSGKDPLERLVKYLQVSDPVIEHAVKCSGASFKYDVKFKSADGTDHVFDAYFESENSMAYAREKVGITAGRFSVYIKVFSKPMTLDDLSLMRKAVESDIGRNSTFPLRIVALQWDISELDDDVYEYVLENPLIAHNTRCHLQIAAEDGDVYSFIPIIAYEMEDGADERCG